jgi:hypothetical protein
MRLISSASWESSSFEQREKLLSFRSSTALASPTSVSASICTRIWTGGPCEGVGGPKKRPNTAS